MKTLYISDLDGTLLNSNGVLTKETIDIIKHITEKGEVFSLATSRPFSIVKKIVMDLEIKCPVVIYNGVFIVDYMNNKTIVSNYFNMETNEYLKKLFKEYNILPNVYSFIEGIECVSLIPHESNKYFRESRKADKRIKLVNYLDKLYDGNIFSYLCMGDKEKIQPIYERLKKDNKVYCVFQQELYNKEEYWLDIAPKEATKASATLKLKKLLNCDKIVSFGDGINDIELFEISDDSYAVQNAKHELKKIATGVIDSNDNNGVAKWLSDNI